MNEGAILARLLTSPELTAEERQAVNNLFESADEFRELVDEIGRHSGAALERVDLRGLWDRQFRKAISEGVYDDYVYIKEGSTLGYADIDERRDALINALEYCGIHGGAPACLAELATAFIHFMRKNEAAAKLAADKAESTLALFEGVGDIPRYLGLAYRELGLVFQVLGDLDKAFGYYESAMDAFYLVDDPLGIAVTLDILECVLLSGEAQECIDRLEPFIEKVRSGDIDVADEFYMLAHILRARAYWQLGFYNLARTAIEEADVCAIKRALQDQPMYVALRDLKGLILACSGSFEEGSKIIRELLEMAERGEIVLPFYKQHAHIMLAYCCGVAGRLAEGLRILEDYDVEKGGRGRIANLLSASRSSLFGCIYFLMDDLKRSRIYFEEVVSITDQAQDRLGLVAHAKFHLSVIAARESNEALSQRLHKEALDAVSAGHWVRSRVETGQPFLMCPMPV